MCRSLATLFFILILVAGWMGGSFLWDAYGTKPATDAPSISFEITEGTNARAIARALAEQHIISSERFFRWYATVSDTASQFQVGTFALKSGMSYRDIARTFLAAKPQEVQITIPEGYTLAQIGDVVVETFPHIDRTEWDRLVSAEGVAQFRSTGILDTVPAGQGLEGYLFPDTYRFRPNADAATIIETMLLTLKRRLAENQIAVDAPSIAHGFDLHQFLTLASIVEREVRSPNEMKTVAGIFLKRLSIGMALQADSTVNYVTGKTTPSVSYDDLQIESRYNTYQHTGLTPGPISNAGVNAWQAVLHPAQTSALYFLTSPDGTVYYADTFAQHLANRKYLR